jgi:uncharacterized membrane protein YkoI
MNTPSKTKRVVYATLVGIGLTAGSAGLAAAATNQADGINPSVLEQTQTDGEQSPTYRSSVTVAETPDSGPESDNEAADAATLGPLAKITPEQAAAAATAAVPGTAGEVELEDENGNVVFGVEVTAADGTMSDVKVDAGTGAVLSNQSDDGDEREGTETEDGSETESGTESSDGAAQN